MWNHTNRMPDNATRIPRIWNLSRTNSYMERFSLPYPHRYGFLPYPHDNPAYMESQLYVLTTPPPTDTQRERERAAYKINFESNQKTK